MNHRSPRRQKKQRQPTNTQQQQRQAQDPPPAPELAAFSLAAAIQEARTEQQQQSQPQQPQARSFFQKLTSSSPLKKKNFPSQASLATNTSFATANDATNTSFRTSAEEQLITPSAASYFVDSDDSSDEETTESLTFGNDPLSVLSRNIDLKPTEISFVDHQDNPEETTINMAKKKTSKIAPTPAVVAEATPVPEATPTTEDIVVSEDPHFDVAQTIYGTTKNIWAWGKTIPVISSILSLTEGATAKVLDVTIHMDLPSIDQDVVTPKAKELDDGVITPVICKIWELVGPAVGKGEDMIVKPFVGEVVPRVLGPLGLLGEEKKVVVVEEKKNVIDGSDNPEVVPPVALN